MGTTPFNIYLGVLYTGLDEVQATGSTAPGKLAPGKWQEKWGDHDIYSVNWIWKEILVQNFTLEEENSLSIPACTKDVCTRTGYKSRGHFKEIQTLFCKSVLGPLAKNLSPFHFPSYISKLHYKEESLQECSQHVRLSETSTQTRPRRAVWCLHSSSP